METIPEKTKTNPRFVGLAMSLCIPGSAHVLSGRWKAGIMWFCSLWALSCLDSFVLSIPVSLSFATIIAILIFLFSSCVICYIVFLVSSYRLTVPRFRYYGWFLFLLFSIIYKVFVVEFILSLEGTYIGRHSRVVRWAMYPTLIPDSPHWEDQTTTSVWAYRFSDPRRGDIIGFKMGEQPWWKQPRHVSRRVVGLPGETVDICPPYVFVNGKKLLDPPIFTKISSCKDGYSGYVYAKDVDTERILKGVLPPEEIELPITLGPDEYFLLGDNSPESLDSRHLGPIPREAIVGQVTRIIFPPWRIQELITFDSYNENDTPEPLDKLLQKE